MGAEYHHRARRHLAKIIDEGDAPILKSADDVAVVNDFMENEHPPAGVQRKHPIDHIDGHADTGTESSGVGQDESHGDQFQSFGAVGGMLGLCRLRGGVPPKCQGLMKIHIETCPFSREGAFWTNRQAADRVR